MTLKIKTTPVFFPPDGGTVTVASNDGDTLYYGSAGTYNKDTQVSSSANDGSISAGSSTNSTVGLWVVSASTTVVTVTHSSTDAVVQTAEIEDDAVTTAKIAALAVDTAELAADAVTGAKIEDDAVDSEHIAADAVDSEHYAAGSIDNEHLAADVVTGDEVSGGVAFVEDLSQPDLADDDRFLLDVDMQATAYTLDETTLPADNPPRNVTITHTAGDTADTLGDAVVVGTNVNDEAINETITISSGGVATGTKAFKTITSVTTASWVIDGVEATADNIKVGFGNLLGLSRPYAATSDVKLATLGTAIVSPTVAVDSDEVEKNTVDISSGTYDGSKAAKAITTP